MRDDCFRPATFSSTILMGCRGALVGGRRATSAHVGAAEIGDALVGVGILAAHDDDVAIIYAGRGAANLIPGQQRFRAHVDELYGAAKAVGRAVGKRAVQSVAVEHHGGTGRDLDDGGSGFRLRKAEPDNFWTLLGKLVSVGGWALLLVVLVPMLFSWLMPGPVRFKAKK